MQSVQTPNTLIVRETPGCVWIVGLLFALIGGALVYGALGGFADYDRHEAWMLAAAFMMGSIGVATGGWMIYRAPVTRVEIDRLEQTVLVTRYGLFGRRETGYEFNEIEQFSLLEECDREGDPVFWLAMDLRSGERLKISSLPNHDERFKREFVFQTNEFMHKRLPTTEMIFEAADDDFPEIG